ncbi:RNA-binding S4 domain-containing protein [Raineyella fluvialis]|uniref:RNA-binding S4 domain-containing protein n=1 Tax=Raineyella fluvialis TaxID=2662261 RepID=A0A5Q2FAG9_9ACTN|nr:RNA-binding S4 domain-containing protein [Raineyella fluvialis]QGF23688.1 RNA-binding S4 domain-containing protein [Raineyella fluvialis]
MQSTPDPSEEPTIRLGQFLKWANLAESGSEARDLIQDGRVRVDGEVETRRGRQLHLGQRVTLAYPGEDEITVVVEDL